jgi:hypothetical protein
MRRKKILDRMAAEFNFSPIWASWTFLMAYPKEKKFKSSGSTASKCFRTFWIGK